MKSFFLGIIISLLLASFFTIAAEGDQPSFFSGTVTINGNPAPDIALITAKIEGDAVAAGTPVEGVYGMPPADSFWIGDPQANREGATVEFFIQDVFAGEGIFLAGHNVNVPLSVSGIIICGDLICEGDETPDTCYADCGECGNEILEGPEPCDGSNLDEQTCETQGFDYGALTCAADCMDFDTTGCGYEGTQICGNNIKEGTEVCDGTDHGSQTCVTKGFASGTLVCLEGCNGWDTSGCTPVVNSPPPSSGGGGSPIVFKGGLLPRTTTVDDEEEEPVPTLYDNACTSNWVCSEWLDCINDLQKRVCVDSNQCDDEESKPPTMQTCESQTVDVESSGTPLTTDPSEPEASALSRITGAVIGGGKGSIISLIVLLAVLAGIMTFIIFRKNGKK
ncbi:MAG: hypothetical protein KKG59_01870 [Nanoarchaeota archaeon]|nr:hypothetical protein [Nanoarchaeota archaeon]